MNKQPKYEEAFAELQAITHKMENDELDIDQMSEQLKRAKELIKLCKDKQDRRGNQENTCRKVSFIRKML